MVNYESSLTKAEISSQSSLSTVVKSGRLNGMDALLVNFTLSTCFVQQQYCCWCAYRPNIS